MDLLINLIPHLPHGLIVTAMNDEMLYSLQNASTPPLDGGVLAHSESTASRPLGSSLGLLSLRAWLDWLRCWILVSCGYVEAGVQNNTPLPLYQVSRRRRHSNAYFARHRLPPSRNLSPFSVMLPKGLSPTQRLERMSRISVLGRLRFYRMRCANPTAIQLRARARLVCYDHGWWRKPFLSLRAWGLARGSVLLPPWQRKTLIMNM